MTKNSEDFEFVLQRYADADRKTLRDAFLQDPNGDPDRVRWAAVTLCKKTLGFESMTGREFTPDQRDLDPASYLQKMKKIAVDGTVESLWSPDYKAFQAIPKEDFQARLKYVREKSPDRFSERAGEWASKVWHGSQLSDDELSILGDDVTPEDRSLMDRLGEIEKGRRREKGRTTGMNVFEREAMDREKSEYEGKRKRIDELRQIARDRKDVADYEAELMRQNAWAAVAQASKGLESVFGEEIVEHALANKGKLDPERLDKFSSMPLSDQRKVVPMLHALREASDGRSWVGDVSRAFLRGVVETPYKAGNYLFYKGVEAIYQDSELYQILSEQQAMLELANEAPMRDWGGLGNAVIGVASTLPYMGYAATGVGSAAIIGSAAQEMEMRIAAEGGDVSSFEAQAGALAAGVAYWGVERMQASALFGPIEKLGTRQAFLTLATHVKKRAGGEILKSSLRVGARVAGQTAGETFEESLQRGLEDGYVALGLGKDAAAAVASGMVQEIGDSGGTMFLMSLIGAGRQAHRYRSGVFNSKEELVSTMLLNRDLAAKFASGDYGKKDLDTFGTQLGMLFRGWISDGGNIANFAKRFKLDVNTAILMSHSFEKTYKAIGGDAEKMKTAMGGRKMLSVSEQVSQAMPWMQATQDDDGTIHLTRADGAPAGSPQVDLTIRTRPASEFAITDDKLMDDKDDGYQISIVNAINARGGSMTLEYWRGMTLEERRKAVAEKVKVDEAKFTVADADGNEVTEGDLAKLSGKIDLNVEAMPGAQFHEIYHAVMKLLKRSGLMTKEVVDGFRAAFGDPLSESEDHNEEAGANAFQGYLGGKFDPVSKGLFDKFADGVNRLLTFVRGVRKEAEDDLGEYERFVESIRTGNIRQVPVVMAEFGRKAKEAAAKAAADKAAAAKAAAAPGDGATPPAAPGDGATPPAAPGDGATPPAAPGEGATPPVANAATPVSVALPTSAPGVIATGTAASSPSLKKPRMEGSWTALTPSAFIKVEGVWGVIEVEDAITSDKPGYNSKFQNRNADKLSSQAYIEQIGKNIQPSLYGENPKADDGAPMLSADMQVIVGNHRFWALKYAISNGLYVPYLEFVKSKAQELGIDISRFKHPVLVRIMSPKYSEDQIYEIAIDCNRLGKAKLDEIEAAKQDAKMISGTEILETMDTGASGNLAAASNRPFMQAFLKRINEPGLITKDGVPVLEAYARVRNASIAALFVGMPDYDNFISRIIQQGTTEDGIGVKREADGIISASPQLVKMSRKRPEYSINVQLGVAFMRYMDYRNRGGKPEGIEQSIAQDDMFAQRDELNDAILRQIGMRHSTGLIADLLNEYAARATIADSDMFGNAAPTALEVFQQAAKSTMPEDLAARQAAEIAALRALANAGAEQAAEFLETPAGERLGELEANVGRASEADEAERQALVGDLRNSVGQARHRIAWHGSPHLFDPEPGFPNGRFRLDKMGSGEGAQSYGWGAYFADHEYVARNYVPKPDLSEGALYRVDIPDDVVPKLLDWDKMVSEQREFNLALGSAVKKLKGKDRQEIERIVGADVTGRQLYKDLSHRLGSDQAASEMLARAGIPGLRFLDQLSRTDRYRVSRIWENEGKPGSKQFYVSANTGYRESFDTEEEAIADAAEMNRSNKTWNYVVWDQDVLDRIALLHRNGEALDAMRKAQVTESARHSIRSREILEPDNLRQYLESKAVQASQERLDAVREQIQMMLPFMDADPLPPESDPKRPATLGAADSPALAALKSPVVSERSKRKIRAFRIMKAIADPDAPEKISKEELNAAFDEGEEVSIILPEFYQEPFKKAWPISGFKIHDAGDIAMLSMQLRSPYQESFRAVYLDKDNVVLDGCILSIGTIDSAMVPFDVLFSSMPAGTVSVVLGHNHPSGDPSPSSEDLAVSRHAVELASKRGVKVIDHVITNGTKYYSIARNGLVDFHKAGKTGRRGKLVADWVPQTADWEAFPLFDAQDVNHPELVQIVSENLRHADSDSVYVYYANRKLKLLGVSRIRSGRFRERGIDRKRWIVGAGSDLDVIFDVVRRHPETSSFFIDTPNGFFTDKKELDDWAYEVVHSANALKLPRLNDVFSRFGTALVTSSRSSALTGIQPTAFDIAAESWTGAAVREAVVQRARMEASARHSIRARSGAPYQGADVVSYLAAEAKQRYANDVRFANWAHKDLAYITAAAWDGILIPPEILMADPKIQEAQNRASRPGSLDVDIPVGTNAEIDDIRTRSVHRLFDAEHGSAVGSYKPDGRFTIMKINGVDQYTGEVRRERKAALVIGRPASGKSSVFADRLSHETGARIIDSDIVKPWFGEHYDDGYGAAYVQTASAVVADAAIDVAMERGDNLVIPRIGGESAISLVRKMKETHGYTVSLYFNEVMEESSVMRAASRFAMTGRYLDLSYLLSIKDKPLRTFTKYAESGIFEYAEWRNNDVRHNETPRLVWNTGASRPLSEVWDADSDRRDRGGEHHRSYIQSGYEEASGQESRAAESGSEQIAARGTRYSIRARAVTPEQDAAYLAAVEAGDESAAQRMVEAAAHRSGYKFKLFHGTPTGGFTVFKARPTYLSFNKEIAEIYQSPAASSIRSWAIPDDAKPDIYDLYVRADNVFDTRIPRHRRMFYNEFFGKGGEEWQSNGTPLTEKGLPDWTDGQDLHDWFEETGLQFDAMILDEGGLPQNDGSIKDRGESVVVWNPAQIKSAATVTRDDAGRVIPLSARFNEKSPDIRHSIRARSVTPEQDAAYMAAVEAGDMETAQRMVDEAAKKAGYNVGPVYHGTTQDFTEFKYTDDIGFHFGTEEQAKNIAIAKGGDSGKVMPAHLDLRNNVQTADAYAWYLGRPTLRVLNRAGVLTDEEVADILAFSKTDKAERKYRGSGEARLLAIIKDSLIGKGIGSISYENATGEGVGMSYIVLDPSQIKSADAVTRDDAGRVIPLSARFNEKSPDTRHSIRGRESAASRTVEEVLTSTQVSWLRKHPDFDAAKTGGDAEAAVRLVEKFFKPESVRLLKESLPSGEVYLVPVLAKEGESMNMIPLRFADRLSIELGIPVWTKLFKTSSAHNTDIPADQRNWTRHEWDGELPPEGAKLVFVDDTYTTGQTISSMAEVAGEPVGIVALAFSMNGKGYRLSDIDEKRMLDKAGITKAEFEAIYEEEPIQRVTGGQARHYFLKGRRGPEGLLAHIPPRRGGSGVRQAENAGGSEGGEGAAGRSLDQGASGAAPQPRHRIAPRFDPYDDQQHVTGRMLLSSIIATDRVKGIQRDESEYEEIAGSVRVDLAEARKDADAVLASIKKRSPSFDEIHAALAAGKADELFKAAGEKAAKLGANVATLAQKGLMNAQRQAIDDADEVAMQDFKSETGVDPARDLVAVAPALFDPDYEPKPKKSEKSEKSEGEGGAESEADAEAQPTPEQQAMIDAERKRREGAFSKLLDMLSAFRADQDVKRIQRRREAEERRKKREAQGEKCAAGEDEEADEDEEKFTLPEIDGESAEIKTAAEFAYVLKIGVRQWIERREQRRRERSGERAPGKARDVFSDPVNVATYRKSMVAILKDIAKKWVDPNAAVAYNAILRAISEIPSNATVAGIELRTARVVAMIQRNAVRLSRKKLMADLDQDIQRLAVQGKELDALEKDSKRKVKGEHEAMARFVKKMLQWSPERCGAEIERLHKLINDRTKAYGADEDSSDLDTASDVEIHRWHEQIRVLERWGGMKDLLPGEILSKGAEIREWLDKLRLEHLRAMEEKQRFRDEVAVLLQNAIMLDPSSMKPKWKLGRRLADEFTATLRQRLEAVMLVKDMNPAEREAATRGLEAVMDLVSKGSQTYRVLTHRYRKQFDNAVKNSIQGTGMTFRKFLKLLDEEIPEELNRKITSQLAQGVRMTWGQAAQLYASLRQTETYRQNINTHNRQDQAEMLKEAMPVQILRFISAMREVYQVRREELSRVQEAVTGFPVYNPDPLYMPVKIFRDPHGELDNEFRGWKPIPKAFAPRVPHHLDFNEESHIMQVCEESMRNTALAVAFGESGLDLRSILARKDVYSVIVRYHGKDAAQRIIEQVTDHLMDGYRQKNEASDQLVKRVSTLHTYAALSWNASSGLKQAFATPAWAAVLDGGIRDVWVNLLRHDKASARELMESPGFLARYGAHSMRELIRDAWTDPSKNVLHRFYQAGMTPIMACDLWASMRVGVGVYKSRRDALIRQGVPEGEARERAARATWALIEEAQQSDRPENTPDLLRRRGFYAKQMYKFQSANVLQFSHEFTALMRWRESKGANRARARKKFVNAVIANHLLMPLGFAIVQSLVGLALNGPPDDEEEWMKEFFGNLLLEMVAGPFGHIMFFGGLMRKLVGTGLKQAGLEPRMYGRAVFPSLDMLDRLQRRGLVTMSDIAQADWEGVRDDVLNLLGQVNVPMRYADRMWWTWVEDEDEAERRRRMRRAK